MLVWIVTTRVGWQEMRRIIGSFRLLVDPELPVLQFLLVCLRFSFQDACIFNFSLCVHMQSTSFPGCEISITVDQPILGAQTFFDVERGVFGIKIAQGQVVRDGLMCLCSKSFVDLDSQGTKMVQNDLKKVFHCSVHFTKLFETQAIESRLQKTKLKRK